MDFSKFAYRPGNLYVPPTKLYNHDLTATIDLTGIDNSKEECSLSKEDVHSVPEVATRDKEPSQAHHTNSSSASNSYTKDSGLKEVYKSPSQGKEMPLRMVIIGHNPSLQSWTKGHYYANPANRMWPILTKANIVPKHFNCYNDQVCPAECGIGFTDVLVGYCETQSANIDDLSLTAAKTGLYSRLLDHCGRASKDLGIPIEYCYPRIIAFAGVRQYKAFLDEEKSKKSRKRKESTPSIRLNMFYDSVHANKSRKTDQFHNVQQGIRRETVMIDGSDCDDIEYDTTNNRNNNLNKDISDGVPKELLDDIQQGKWTIGSSEEGKTCFGVQLSKPSDWPSILQKSIIVLLPSTSGAAAMTTEAREGPYILLGKLLQFLQYETNDSLQCELPVWRYVSTAAASHCCNTSDDGGRINMDRKASDQLALTSAAETLSTFNNTITSQIQVEEISLLDD